MMHEFPTGRDWNLWRSDVEAHRIQLWKVVDCTFDVYCLFICIWVVAPARWSKRKQWVLTLTGGACVCLMVAGHYPLVDSKLVRYLIQWDLRGLKPSGCYVTTSLRSVVTMALRFLDHVDPSDSVSNYDLFTADSTLPTLVPPYPGTYVQRAVSSLLSILGWKSWSCMRGSTRSMETFSGPRTPLLSMPTKWVSRQQQKQKWQQKTKMTTKTTMTT